MFLKSCKQFLFFVIFLIFYLKILYVDLSVIYVEVQSFVFKQSGRHH